MLLGALWPVGHLLRLKHLSQRQSMSHSRSRKFKSLLRKLKMRFLLVKISLQLRVPRKKKLSLLKRKN